MAPQVPDLTHRQRPFYTDYLFGRSYPLAMTEDGLYLNLWTPSLDTEAKRPVVVWLHGGGFTTGAATRPREDGATLSRNGDVVVVSPTHRLGAFGYAFFGSHGSKGATANVGLLDIIAALRWVQDNIRGFGGDPGNVTIMGESGGSMKVSALLAMPGARGLFHRAACLGGSLVYGHTEAVSVEQAVALTDRLTRHLGVRAADLCDVPTGALVDAEVQTTKRPLVWRPVIDGETLPDHPDKIMAAGAGADVPLLVGSSAHEGDFLSQISPVFDVRAPGDLALFVGDRAGTLSAGYRRDELGQLRDDRETALAMLGDYYMRIPGIVSAESHGAAGRTSYMYLFDWTQPRAPSVRSTHGAETVFIFGNLDTTGVVRGFEEAVELSQQVQNAWIAFFRRGDPNHPSLAHWPAYTATTRQTMCFAASPVVVSDPGGDARRTWCSAPQRRPESRKASA